MTTRVRKNRVNLSTSILLAVAFVIAGSFVPARSNADGSQVVNGHVSAPAGPITAGPVWSGACSLADVMLEWATNTRDTFAYQFEIDPATRELPFVLESFGPADLVIMFDDGGERRIYDTAGVGSERGTVPMYARSATVCLVAGAEASFTYTAGRAAG